VQQQSTSFSLNEANALAHALLARIGRDNGIRTLSIKGLVADHHGLRKPRVAADADVIVEPGRFDEFCRLLTAHGWHLRVEREVPSLLGPHSVTFIRDDWPNDIDAHVRFPGFFADDGTVFERLWQTRAFMEAAHNEITVPSRGASAVIAALHAVRYTKSVRHAGELEQIAHLLTEEFTDAEREEFVDVARAGHAQWVLRELFDLIDQPYEVDANPRQQELWDTNRATVEDGAAVSWLSMLKAAPLHRKPAVLFRALWISRVDIPRNDANRMPTLGEAWAHRMLRWRRGAIALWHYARATRRRSTEPS